jgi:hypothetical protein
VADENGDPLLLIEKLLFPSQIQTIRKTATKKRFMKGTVSNENGRLIFRTKKPQKRFSLDLRNHFGREVPLLKQAKVLGLEEAAPAADANEAPRDDADSALREATRAAKKRLEAAQAQAQQLRTKEEDARSQILDIVSKLVSTEDEWAALGFDAQQLASIATDRHETMEANFGMLASFLESQIQLQIGGASIGDEEAQAITDSMTAGVRLEAYQELAAELNILRQDMRELAEELCFIDSAIAQGEAEEAVAAAEREEARAATVRATLELHATEDSLEKMLASSPASAPLAAEARALEQEADLLVDDALDLQMELAELEEERGALLAALREQGASARPEDIIWLATLEEQILTREIELETLIQQTDTIQRQIQTVEADAYNSLEANGDDETLLLMRQVVQQQQAVKALAGAETVAGQAVADAERKAAERTRQRAIVPLLSAANTWVQRSTPVIEVMADIDPRDPEMVQRNSILMIQPGVFNILSDGAHYLQMLTQTGAKAAELQMIFDKLPAAWRPLGYDRYLKDSAEQTAWCESTEPVQGLLQKIEGSIQANSLVPDVRPPVPAGDLQAHLDAFRRRSGSQDARLEDAQIALVLKTHLRSVQDPGADPAAQAEATQAILSTARQQPRSVTAWLAQTGDPDAQKLACAVEMTDEMLARAAPPVALKAMLRRSLDGEGRTESFEQWLSGLSGWTGSLFQQNDAVLQGWFERAASPGTLSTAPLESVPEGTFSGIQHVLAQLRSKHVSVKEQAPSEMTPGMLKQLDAAQLDICDQVAGMRMMIARNLNLIGSIQEQDDSRGDRRDTITALLGKNLTLLQHLATVG